MKNKSIIHPYNNLVLDRTQLWQVTLSSFKHQCHVFTWSVYTNFSSFTQINRTFAQVTNSWLLYVFLY